MRILYIVHDVNDAAVKRRVSMLSQGGAEVTVLGFYRGKKPSDDTLPCPMHLLGETFDASFMHRVLKVVVTTTQLKRHLSNTYGKFDLIIARNLDMLAIGRKARQLLGLPLVYECLDIHRFLISPNVIGKLFRKLEAWLCQPVALLITSSQGFIDNYFNPLSKTDLPNLILENKVFSSQELPTPCHKEFDKNRIVITWNGAIRCRQSLEILSDVTRRFDGRVKVTIWGKPAYTEFDDFDALVAKEPHIDFHGAYRFPEDLAKIYQGADFNWALDFFEQGGNSEWLLPNRIYEGGLFNVPALCRASTFTAHTLSGLGIGTALNGYYADCLESFLSRLTQHDYTQLREQMQSIPRSRWVYDQHQSRELVNMLADVAFQPKGVQLETYSRVSK
ncbi:hypothetical protein [Vibrio paucivorans]